MLGEEKVALTSPWAGYRWGPVLLPGREMRVLPASPARSMGEAPQPLGLVGAHRSRRAGDGTEFAGIRPSTPATGCAGSTGGSRCGRARCTS